MFVPLRIIHRNLSSERKMGNIIHRGDFRIQREYVEDGKRSGRPKESSIQLEVGSERTQLDQVYLSFGPDDHNSITSDLLRAVILTEYR